MANTLSKNISSVEGSWYCTSSKDLKGEAFNACFGRAPQLSTVDEEGNAQI